MLLRSSASALAIAVLLALPGASQAQGGDIYKLPMPQPRQMVGQEMGRAQPGIAASSPVGYGPSQGDIFAGFGYTNTGVTGGDSDGSVSVGAGFFEARGLFGLEAVVTSHSTVRSGFGSRMTAALKAHKTIPSNNIGVGIGIEAVPLVGNDEMDIEPSFYVAGTQVRNFRRASTFNQITLNIGGGTGRYSMDYNHKDWDGELSFGVFASAALRINWASAAIIDYNGGAITLGASFTPASDLPLVITPALADVGDVTNGGRRFTLGVGYSWRY